MGIYIVWVETNRVKLLNFAQLKKKKIDCNLTGLIGLKVDP